MMESDVETILLDSDEDIIVMEPPANPTQNAGTINIPDDVAPNEIPRASTHLSQPVLTPKNEDQQLDGPPPAKIQKLDETFDDDAALCPICLDTWTNLGEHRICALKCGHLFGLSCVTRWFTTQATKCCPTCKVKARKSDIRYIYAKRIIACDVVEVETLKKQLESVNCEKSQLQMDLSKSVCHAHMLQEEVHELKRKIQQLNVASEVQRKLTARNTASEYNVHLFMDKALEICAEGKCRVMDSCSRMDLIVTSMRSQNSLFNYHSYGIRKVNVTTYKPVTFVPLHADDIRDMRFHADESWMLTVSLDKTVKVTDLVSHNTFVNCTTTSPLWSCCWSAADPQCFYAGERHGAVLKFDVRNSSAPLTVLHVPGNLSPVVSLASIAPSSSEAVLRRGGVIVCKLDSLWAFEKETTVYKRHPLPVDGPFTSMSFHGVTRQLLTSTRPTTRYPYARHTVSYIADGKEADRLACNTMHTFKGSTKQTLMSRSCFVTHKSDYVAAYVESHKRVCLWNINTSELGNFLPAHEAVLDLNAYSNSANDFLVRLTAKRLEFFKFIN